MITSKVRIAFLKLRQHPEAVGDASVILKGGIMLKSNKILIVTAAISLILVSSILHAGPSNLFICYDPWPPSMISPLKEDPKRGFVIDMLKDIFQSNGYSITFSKMPYIRAKIETEAGRCHIMAEVVPDKNSKLLFTEMATFPHQYSIFVKKGNPWKVSVE